MREDIDVGAAATVLFGMILGLVNIWALNNHSFDVRQRYGPTMVYLSRGCYQAWNPELNRVTSKLVF